MEVLHERCAGLDLSKRDAKLCVRVVEPGRVRAREAVTTWSSMTADVLALRDHLIAERVTCVAMEATGDYWKPFYYVLEDGPFQLMLVNAHDAKNLPGRKTDVSDAAWLAQLAAHGLLRASFVPPEPIRQLRDLTRTRTAITRERAREAQRLEKVLEDAGIKLSVVATDITGVSGRAILRALVAGERDPAVLADLSVQRLRVKIPALTQALAGRFSDHHAFLVELHLNLIDQHTAAIDTLTERIEEAMVPFRAARELICTIPGIGVPTADVIIAETGADMSVFPTPGQLASWAGVCPGHHESAGRAKSGKTRPGDRWLKGALGAAALSIARHPGTHLHAKYQRLAKSRGRAKAVVAIEHTLLTLVWNLLTTGALYDDPAPTTTPAAAPNGPRTMPSTNYKPSATTSPSKPAEPPDLIFESVSQPGQCDLLAGDGAQRDPAVDELGQAGGVPPAGGRGVLGRGRGGDRLIRFPTRGKDSCVEGRAWPIIRKRWEGTRRGR